jgi:hypothetical protein
VKCTMTKIASLWTGGLGLLDFRCFDFGQGVAQGAEDVRLMLGEMPFHLGVAEQSSDIAADHSKRG